MLGVSAAAQEESEPAPRVPQTVPPDLGYGENQLAEHLRFPDEADYQARVDRRDDVDAASHRTILWPTAHTPPQWTVQYSNFMGALNQLSFSPTDSVQVSGTFLIPSPTADLMGGLATKIRLQKTVNSELSLQPFGFYRNGNGQLGTRDLGFGVAGLFDFIVTNNFVATFGLVGYGTVFYGRDVFSYESCESRRDFLDGTCREVETDGSSFPSGGHFFGAQLAGSYYILNQFSLRGELFTGVAAGSVLGTEFLVDRPDIEADRRRFEDGEVAVGLPYDGKVTVGMGLQWSNGLFALQFSGYVYRGESALAVDFEGNRRTQFLLTPMLNGAIAF